VKGRFDEQKRGTVCPKSWEKPAPFLGLFDLSFCVAACPPVRFFFSQRNEKTRFCGTGLWRRWGWRRNIFTQLGRAHGVRRVGRGPPAAFSGDFRSRKPISRSAPLLGSFDVVGPRCLGFFVGEPRPRGLNETSAPLRFSGLLGTPHVGEIGWPFFLVRDWPEAPALGSPGLHPPTDRRAREPVPQERYRKGRGQGGDSLPPAIIFPTLADFFQVRGPSCGVAASSRAVLALLILRLKMFH